jgi:hypothetical protein
LDDTCPFFGVELFGHGSGAFDITKQNRDDTAFTYQLAGRRHYCPGVYARFSLQCNKAFAQRRQRLIHGHITKDFAHFLQ